MLTLLLPAVVLVVFGHVGFFSLVMSLFRIRVCLAFIMTLHLTINSYQPLFDESFASVAAPVHQSTDVGESITSAQAGPSSGISLSPEIVALIAQSVQAAKVAERAKTSTLLTMSFTPGAIGGVPMISTPTANVAQPSAGRPVSTSSVMVPSFAPTFTAPALPAISFTANTASSLGRSSHDAMVSVPPTSASVMADQPFVVGHGISPVMVKLVFQIVTVKYVDLCDLLPVNLQAKEPNPSPPFWCCTFLTTGGTFCNISFSSFVHICILAAMFGWPMTGPFMSMQWPHSSRTGRV